MIPLGRFSVAAHLWVTVWNRCYADSMGRARTAARAGVVALCGLALGVIGCSSESGGGTGQTAGSGAAGGVSGGSGGSAGSSNLLIGDPPDCPEVEPAEGDSCQLSGYCHYSTCGDGVRSLWECDGGTWHALRSCDAQCPETRPAAFTDCTSYWDLMCPYTEDACGTEQGVLAHCNQGTWMLWGPSREEASPACQLSYPDGAECVLPDGCSALTCYDISCYGQPVVSECLDGKWRVQTSCSK
jgi:hypothetical protein